MSKANNLKTIDPAKLSTAALNTFENIVAAWGLKQVEAMTLLGYEESTRSTYFKWKRTHELERYFSCFR